ncbi:helix-turn-helix domain-containing protein [soil metagenome]
MTATNQNHEVQTPKPSDVELAKESSRKLASRLRKNSDLRLRFQDGRKTEELVLPHLVAKKLLEMLVEIGMGNAVQLTAIQPEITTQQAADLLNVSRPYVVKLVEEGTIPSRKVGPRRLLLLDDVAEYKKQMYGKRLNALNQLTQLSEDLGMYDDGPEQ